MRRETDFVLEKAAWPAMLLEAGGRICRANQAARRVFGLGDEVLATPLSALWDEQNATAPADFLQHHIGSETAPLKLRAHGGEKKDFIAHVAKVVREEQDYFLLQLFKESGAAFSELAYVAAPVIPAAGTEKNKIPVDLMQAGWPALLVDAQGKIIHGNSAAARVFGDAPTVAALCPLEDAASLRNFLQSSAGPSTLHLSQTAGPTGVFRVEHCRAGDSTFVLLQFFTAESKAEAPGADPAKKKDEDFLLQNADWPVFLVHKNGKVVQTNRAGVRAFGAGIEREEARLETIWSPQNRDSCQQFLNLPPAEPMPLHFHLKSGLPGEYWGQVCGTSDEDIFLLQLLKEPAAVAERAAAPKSAADTSATALSAMSRGEVEVNQAHKQKLDCALQLTRSVALDFNNALTSILGHASLLLSKTESNNPWRSSLVEIEKSAAKAAEVANDLAAFSRQEKDTRVQVAGNLNMLLERTVEIVQATMQNPILISRQLERKLFTASFDEAKMQQALVKIFENAVESIKKEGKINVQTRNLELSEATQDRTAKLNPGNYVCVEISDTGSGIAEDIMPHIFEPFFSTKGARHRGLGLAWVYGIVTNHGGGVAVSSQPDIGTTVRLYLPASTKIVRDAPMTDGDLTGTETVLFVDDEDLLLTMGRMVLSSYGYTVLTANSGQKALELFTRSKKKIDLVVTDLVMPNMSGRELSERILAAAPDTRIIWSSGYVRSADAHEQERYLQKPFSSQDLLRKVKQVLRQ